MNTEKEKRPSGQKEPLTDIYLVISESTGNSQVGYTHSCGTDIICKTVDHPVFNNLSSECSTGESRIIWTPYCPHCEEAPADIGDIIYKSEQSAN